MKTIMVPAIPPSCQKDPASVQPSDCPPIEYCEGAQDQPLIILCDHARNSIPPHLNNLGLTEEVLSRHIAYDPGALAISQALSRAFQADLVATTYSRLVIDPNRDPHDPTSVMQISDGDVIPGNAHLSPQEHQARVAHYYRPYHEMITQVIDAKMNRGLVPVLISVHSFTPVWRGRPRPWHLGLLWDEDDRLVMKLLERLNRHSDVIVGDNEPYTGRLKGDTMNRHGTRRGLPHVLIEVRNDLIATAKGVDRWSGLLIDVLSDVLSNTSFSPNRSDEKVSYE
jgi:predicted N-formylglutamate amidohydrolase